MQVTYLLHAFFFFFFFFFFILFFFFSELCLANDPYRGEILPNERGVCPHADMVIQVTPTH